MDDIEAIKQLTHRYNLAFDYGKVDAYLDCWTADGFFERSNAGRSYRGHAELDELIRTFPVDGATFRPTSSSRLTATGPRRVRTCCIWTRTLISR
jgi:hypothetical protein